MDILWFRKMKHNEVLKYPVDRSYHMIQQMTGQVSHELWQYWDGRCCPCDVMSYELTNRGMTIVT